MVPVKQFCLCVGIVMAAMLPAHAQNVMFNTLGDGIVPCSDWTIARSHGPNPDSTAIEQWVIGFFVGREDGLDVLVSRNITSTDSFLSWIDRYCIKNQDQPISSAAEAYVQQFSKTNPPND